MKTYAEQIEGLNEQQKKAVEIQENAVVAAGAGSGKTKVLATRFLHLVTQRQIPVDEILALTFTRKAAAEMRTRIYAMLTDASEAEAKEAAGSFYTSRISTLDSFCTAICRDGCRAYGVAPDFTLDNDTAMQIAKEKALSFILQHRSSEAIRDMLKKFALKDLPEDLFAKIMTEHSSISAPLDFEKIGRMQSEKVREAFANAVRKINAQINELRNISAQSKSSGKTLQDLQKSLQADFDIPDTENREKILAFLENCAAVNDVPNRLSDEIKEIKNEFKEETEKLFALTNYLFNEDVAKEMFKLLAEFQEIFNNEKRSAGILTFRDAAQMAVDALTNDIGLRNFYKNAIQSIMIDEFQDNNELQRDLLYLISEKKSDASGSASVKKIPGAQELTPGKLFFVGDEKQSIYLFRGADVSVFRKLKTDLGSEIEMPQLSVNYRTEKSLLEIFNAIFPYIFLSGKDGNPIPQYEAEFVPIETKLVTEGCEPGFEVLLLADKTFASLPQGYLEKTDTEAAEVAQRIQALIDGGFQVRDEKERGKTRNCTYNDIALLFRTTTHQKKFERQLRNFGIPYQTEAVSDLFSDAPANDICAFLRLAINPEDTFSYSVVLHSPFVSADDETFTRILAARATAEEADASVGEPFSEADAQLASETCRKRFDRAAQLYREIKENADKIATAQLISKLWYDYGYRYNTILDPALLNYAEIYDYLFELARQADVNALSLSEFLDSLEEKKQNPKELNNINIPVGKSNCVHLLTVHKSKGLEFPVVFLVDAGTKSQVEKNDEPFYFSHEYSVTINTNMPKEFSDAKPKYKELAKSNFFYQEAKKETDAKLIAELRRTLYVALTRAEIKIFVSGIFQLPENENLEKARTEQEIKELLQTKFQEKKDNPKQLSFFDLLLSAIIKAEDKASAIRISEILPKKRTKQNAENQSANRQPPAADAVVSYQIPERHQFTASGLHDVLASGSPAPRSTQRTESEQETNVAQENREESTNRADRDRIDALLETHGVTPAEFGTYVHAAIEQAFTGEAARIPQELRAEAEKLAQAFFNSETGKAAKNATWRKIEYGFLTRIKIDGLPDDSVIAGQMDLIFEADGNLFLVDYKTDRTENPEIHRPQLQLYAKAAKKLFGKTFPDAKIIPLLYYLRSGNVVEIEQAD